MLLVLIVHVNSQVQIKPLPKSGFEKRIRNFVEQIKIVDTHDHLMSFGDLNNVMGIHTFDFPWLLADYASGDIFSAGMSDFGELLKDSLTIMQKWEAIKPYWEGSSNTAFNRAVLLTADKLFGVPNIDSSTVEKLSEEIRKAYQNPNNWFYEVLKNKCNIQYVVNDNAFWGRSDFYDTTIFRFVTRFDNFIDIKSKSDIEKLIKWKSTGINTLSDLESALRMAFQSAMHDGMVGIKSGLAYSRIIKYDNVKKEQAEEVFNKIMNTQTREQLINKGDIGTNESWFKPSTNFSDWKEMKIPGTWEKQGLEDIDGVVWFKTEFELTGEEVKNGIILNLGTIDDGDRTFVNGQFVGEMSESLNKSRSYKVSPSALFIGKNLLVIKVIDTGGKGGIYGSDDEVFLMVGNVKKKLAGNWKYKIGIALDGASLSFEEVNPLQDYMMYRILDLANANHLPFQIHTGLNGRSNIENSKPTHLVNLFQEYPDMKFIIFHGAYPYGGELSTLAKNFRNVYIDMCWDYIISPSYSERYLNEWLETVPVNKIMAFGGDFFNIEGTYGHLLFAKQIISNVLISKVTNFYYQATGRENERRIAVVRKDSEKHPKTGGKLLFPDIAAFENYKYAAFVTNLDFSAEMIWSLYNHRADCENRIRELKYDYGIEGFFL